MEDMGVIRCQLSAIRWDGKEPNTARRDAIADSG
jgi:hypothetical protein